MPASSKRCRSRRSSLATRWAAWWRSSCWTAASAPPAWQSIPRPRAASWPVLAPRGPACRPSWLGQLAEGSTDVVSALRLELLPHPGSGRAGRRLPAPGRSDARPAATGSCCSAGTRRSTSATASRAPLLITVASKDRAVDASTIRSNYRKYRHSPAVTELLEFPDRTHWLIAAPGWDEVADAILGWVAKRSR